VTPPTRTSATAVASLLFGLFACVPFNVSLIALAFGGVPAVASGCFALVVTGSPRVRGRGLAVAGVVLGVAGIVGWSAHIARHGIAPDAARLGAPDPAVAREFFTRASHGDVPGATALCTPGTDRADVEVTVDQMRPLGPILSIDTRDTSPHGDRTMIDGTIRFHAGPRRFDAVVERGTGPTPQVQSWGLQPASP